MPFFPAGMLDVVIVSAGGAGASIIIVRETDLVWAGFPPSMTVAVKLLVPFAVGVPETSPVVAFRPSPAGKLPAVMDQA